MEKRHFNGHDISLLGYGLMRLPRLPGGAPGKPAAIDTDKASMLIDQAIKSGVNYFDTAYTYGGSEAFAGQALSKYPRDSYYLATKCPPWMIKNEEDFERIFAEQLERCQTDYFDFYLVHNLAQESKRADGNDAHFEEFQKLGMFEMLEKKRAEGKIRWIGFSFHGTPTLLTKLASGYKWDFAQIQINYVDWKATDAKTQYDILTENNIPITIMEPLRGGALATMSEASGKLLSDVDADSSYASWGLRYAASFPNVLTVLSGMNAEEQLVDNVATMSDFKPITATDKAFLEDEVATAYNKSGFVPCTGCAYCMPCPVGVDIPRVFSIYNYYRLVNFRVLFDNAYSSLEESEKASSCIQCGQCTEKCPQHLGIADLMQEINDLAQTPA